VIHKIFKSNERQSPYNVLIAIVVAGLLGIIGCSGDELANNDANKKDAGTEKLLEQVLPCAGSTPLAGCGTSCGNDGESCLTGTYCGSADTCTAECSASVPCSNGKSCDDSGQCAAQATAPISDNDTGAGSNASTDSNTNEPSGSTCISKHVETRAVVPTVTLLVDRSGSMKHSFDGSDRWESVKRVLIGNSASDGGLVKKFEGKARLGMATFTAYSNTEDYPNPNYDPADEESFEYFPPNTTVPHDATLPMGGCPLLDVDVIPALDSAAAIEAAYRTLNYGRYDDNFDDSGKGAETPTGEAVQAIADRLAVVKEKGPKVIILATDGGPDTCEIANNTDINKDGIKEDWEMGHDLGPVKSRNAVRDAYEQHGIKTYIISVGDDIDDEHLQDIANLGVGVKVNIRNVDSDSKVVKCHSLQGSTGQAAPCWQAKGSGAIDGLRQAITGIIESERTCIVQLNGKLDSPEAVCDGVVKLNGDVLNCGGTDGFVYKTSEAIELKGQACDTYKQSSSAVLDANWPCEKIIINTDGEFSSNGGFSSTSFR